MCTCNLIMNLGMISSYSVCAIILLCVYTVAVHHVQIFIAIVINLHFRYCYCLIIK